MTESLLQAENKELTEQLRELSERFDNVVADNLHKSRQLREMEWHDVQNVILKDQNVALIKENHRLAYMILDKQEKGQ